MEFVNVREINVNSLTFDGIDPNNPADSADLFIDYAQFKDGTVLTEKQLDELNENSMFVYESYLSHLY